MQPANALYYGDNLEVLRKPIGDETIDLVHLDPPFNGNRDYNLLFKEQSGEPAQAQIKAFTDIWQWSEHENPHTGTHAHRFGYTLQWLNMPSQSERQTPIIVSILGILSAQFTGGVC